MLLNFGAQQEPSSSDVKQCWRGLCFVRQCPGVVATAIGVTYGLNTRVTNELRRNRCRGVLSDNQNGLPSPLSLGNTWTWIPVSRVTGQTQDGMKLSPHLLTPEHFTLIYPEQDTCTCRPWIKVRHWRPGKRQTSLWSGPDRDAAQLLRQLLWVARPLFSLTPCPACKDLHRHTHSSCQLQVSSQETKPPSKCSHKETRYCRHPWGLAHLYGRSPTPIAALIHLHSPTLLVPHSAPWNPCSLTCPLNPAQARVDSRSHWPLSRYTVIGLNPSSLLRDQLCWSLTWVRTRSGGGGRAQQERAHGWARSGWSEGP